jgi:hypothetical protein
LIVIVIEKGREELGSIVKILEDNLQNYFRRLLSILVN